MMNTPHHGTPFNLYHLRFAECHPNADHISEVACVILAENEAQLEIAKKQYREKLADGVFAVHAPWLERILAGSNVDDWESLQYFQRQLDTAGVLDKLVELGVQENDTIKIGEYEFDYVF